ncbi:baseplate wedge protein [Escherichia phage vB_EcoM_4HA13]|uniref:Baseplate wedge protein n=1 Tax=Escherichia phage vB_EcoM_4HA13 TaxID=2601675 RepID=A0A7D0J672_9CAUD|nr:baseplate wedge subunit [Escherichia phage vB_EcoM_4HA13]QEM43047.1 baseplate wedge protein [Escherichia phage vB_EcoM_4HA13]
MAGNLALDSNHDIIIGRGATRIEGAAQVAQLVKCRLLTLLGEWKLDTSLGLPWFDAIFTKQVRPADIEAALANIIRGTAGVQQLISIDISPDFRERTLSISFIAISDYGDISEYLTWQQSSTA